MVSLKRVPYNIIKIFCDNVTHMSHVIRGTIMRYRVFNDLDLEVIYVNEQLLKGRSLTKIAVEEYGYKSESSLRKRLTKGNLYKRIGQQFIKQVDLDTNKNNTDVRQNVRQDVINIESNKPIEIIDVTTSSEGRHIMIDDRVEGLLENYDILMKMIKEYKALGMQSVNDNGLVINLPVDKGEARVTFRINGTVYEEFQRFVEANKQFRVKELVSAALQEFINKYK